jgi:hypothetical protein
MQELAEDTGGFGVANTNQIEEPRQRRMADIRTHYELAYTPTSTNYDGHFRKIEAKIARPKIQDHGADAPRLLRFARAEWRASPALGSHRPESD